MNYFITNEEPATSGRLSNEETVQMSEYVDMSSSIISTQSISNEDFQQLNLPNDNSKDSDKIDDDFTSVVAIDGQ